MTWLSDLLEFIDPRGTTRHLTHEERGLEGWVFTRFGRVKSCVVAPLDRPDMAQRVPPKAFEDVLSARSWLEVMAKLDRLHLRALFDPYDSDLFK